MIDNVLNMLIKDEHFRNLYKSFIVLKSREDAEMQQKFLKLPSMDIDSDEITLEDIPLDYDTNAVILYPYIDHTAGMSFLVIATALLEGDFMTVYDRQDNFEVCSTIRKESLNDKEFIFAENLKVQSGFDFKPIFQYAADMSKVHMGDSKLETLRMLDLIDDSREDDYPDDILVYFFKENFTPEGIWVRGEELTESCIVGTLLNQPNQDLGVSRSDKVEVYLEKDPTGNIICFVDLN